MRSGNQNEGPLVQFIIICVALMGSYHYGSTFINENRLNASNETTTGIVTVKKQGSRFNRVFYDYLCEADKCLTGRQAVSNSYFNRLDINDQVSITYVERNSKNLTRIEKRKAVYVYSLVMTLFMIGILIFYGRKLKRGDGF